MVLITVRERTESALLSEYQGNLFLLTKVCRNKFSCVNMGVFVLPVQAVHRVSGIRPAGKSL